MLTVGVDTYATRAEADAYWEAHGDPDAWTQTPIESKEAALRYAAVWLDARYWFTGYRVDPTQKRAWPRYAAADLEGKTLPATVPDIVKDAQCEAALSHVRDQALNLVLGDSKSAIRGVQAGTVRVDFGPDGGVVNPTYIYIDMLLDSITIGSASCVALARA